MHVNVSAGRGRGAGRRENEGQFFIFLLVQKSGLLEELKAWWKAMVADMHHQAGWKSD